MIAKTSGAVPVTRVCRIVGANRATLYRRRQPPKVAARRGPKPELCDDELAERIRERPSERERLYGRLR